jgi:hypothetical protein
METKSPALLINLINGIGSGLAKASLNEVVSVDGLSEEDVTIITAAYRDKYEVRKGQIIDGKTLDSSYCLHIRRIH